MIGSFTGNCSAGYKTDKENCTPCPVGTYQPEKWNDTCIKCENGVVTLTPGSTKDRQTAVVSIGTQLVAYSPDSPLA